MSTITIAKTKTLIARMCAILVPKETELYSVTTRENGDRLSYFNGTWCNEDLPAGDWQILGELGHITEEQAAMVVDVVIVNGGGELYRNYGEGLFQSASVAKKTKLESLRTLTDSMEVYAVNPYGKECPKDGKVDRQTLFPENVHDIRKWQRAQSRTGRWIILYQLKE